MGHCQVARRTGGTTAGNMQKIAILVPQYGIRERGVEVFTTELTKRLAGEFEITVFDKSWVWSVGREKWWWVPNGLGRIHLDDVELEMLTFSVGALPRLLLWKWDLIFVQSGVWGAVIARVVRTIKGTPFLYRSAGGREPWIVRQHPNVYVATTKEIGKWIKQFSPKQEVTVIPNGVDLDRFAPRALRAARRRTNKAGLKVLCVGALEPHKRIHLAIAAVAKIANARLTVIGEGPLEEDIRVLGIKMLKNRFKLITRVPFDQMPKYYTRADVFTLPSWEEPFGIVYVEAMAAGLPVVAPEDASRREIIGHNGVLCNVLDQKEYAKAIIQAAKIKPVVDKRFDWVRVAKRYRRLFWGMLNK